MEYTKLSFTVKPEINDVLIARLAEMGFEGFEEEDGILHAFIASNQYSEAEAIALSLAYEASFSKEIIAQQNWNAMWEANFQPVIVEGFCTIRADFHIIEVDTPYEIVITPKMSFGTGHHATTKLMMMQMKNIELRGKKVFDFGTGTGILAILAEILGSTEIVAIDNDEWSYENATENAGKNSCSHITLKQGSIEDASNTTFDIILANINRHILLKHMQRMHEIANAGGFLLMSGLLIEDKEIIVSAAEEVGMKFISHSELNGWISLLFTKD
jgi:ribosomal protein L11 methyltransferase